MDYDEKTLLINKNLISIQNLNRDFPDIDELHFRALILRAGYRAAARRTDQRNEIAISEYLEKLQSELLSEERHYRHQAEDRIYNTIQQLSQSDALDLVTYLIDEAVAAELSIGQSHSAIVATISGTIHSRFNDTELIDALPTTAELSAEKRLDHTRSSFPMFSTISKQHKRLITAKLEILGIKPVFIDPDNWNSSAYSDTNFLIDTSSNALNPKLSYHKIIDVRATLKYMTSLGKCRLMLVTRTRKTSIEGHINRVLSAFDSGHRLEAIINFSSASANNSSIENIFTILSPHENSRKQSTLYVDVSKRNKLLSDLDLQERASLAGNIYNIWRYGSFDEETRTISRKVKRILQVQFGEGYNNVAGLCQEADTLGKDLNQTYSASFYVVRTIGTPTQLDTLINSKPIIELLNTKLPHIIYVIGNNGQGKSLLLKEIIFKLADQQRNTVGLSTSYTDRFPFSDEKIKRYFSYEGIRTAENGVSIVRRIKGATKSLADIFSNQVKLDTFVACLKALDYEPRYYLINKSRDPLDSPKSSGANHIYLNNIANQNVIPEKIGNFDFGVVRSDGEGRITPLSEFSSGELNVTMLLVKIIEKAEKGKTFLIDEPEISLHVKWQQTLPQIFSILSENLKVSFIIATHSPILIANAQSSDTSCYLALEGKLHEIPPSKRHSVETILMDGFKTYTPNNREVHEKCARLIADSINKKNNPDFLLETHPLTELNELEQIVSAKGKININVRHQADIDLIAKAKVAISILLPETEAL